MYKTLTFVSKRMNAYDDRKILNYLLTPELIISIAGLIANSQEFDRAYLKKKSLLSSRSRQSVKI